MKYRLCAVGSFLIWLAACSAGTVPQAGIPRATARAATSNVPTLYVAGTGKHGTGLYAFAESHPPRFLSFKRFPTLHAVAGGGPTLYLGEANRLEARDAASGRLLTTLQDASSASRFSVDAIALSGQKIFAAANATQCSGIAQVCGGNIAVYRIGGSVHPEAHIRWPSLGRVSSLAVNVLGTQLIAGWTDRHLGEHISVVSPAGVLTEINRGANGAQPPSLAFVDDFLAIGAGSSGAFGTGEVELYSFNTGTVVRRFGHLNGALVLAPDAKQHRLFVGAYGFFLLPQNGRSAGSAADIAVFAYPSGFRTGAFGDFTAVYSMAPTPQI